MSKKKIELKISSYGWTVAIMPGNPVTICEIRDENGRVLAYGLGVRKPNDPYDKEIGCRKALEAALRFPVYDGLSIEKKFEFTTMEIRGRYLERFPMEKRLTEAQILIRWFKNLMAEVDVWQRAGNSAVEYAWPPMALIDRGARALAIAESNQIKRARAKRRRRAEARGEREEQR